MRAIFVATIFLRAALASPFSDNIESRAAEPCGQVASALKTSPDGTLSAELALACLKSVPVDVKGDQSQLLGLSTFNNFQSTLAYLKNPPPGYLYPAVDIEGTLQKIASKVKSGGYSNEYDVQNDITKLIGSAHDGHFNYFPDITEVFSFIRNYSMISLSKDGVSVPAVYGATDILVLASAKETAKYKPSPITKINGEDVETFLNNLASSGGGQDPDANYNLLFPIIPLQANGQSQTPLFFDNGFYPGPKTVITFENGTTHTVETIASTTKNFAGVVDGKSFFNKFCQGAPASSSAAVASASASVVASSSLAKRGTPSSAVASASASGVASAAPEQSSEVPYAPVPMQTAVPAPQFYPTPWIYGNNGIIGCYFPTEQNDLAVLAMPSFEPINVVDFEDTTRECLATAAKLGKKKFMVDLRGNGGGNVLMAYDVFKQLFPSIQPWGTTNFHAWTLFDQMGEVITKYYEGTTPANAGKKGFQDAFSSPFNSADLLNEHDGDFKSWDDFYGPVHVHGDTYTNLSRYNLSDPYSVSDSPIDGYGELKGFVKKQTFASADIVLLQDGQCGSTCAVFAELMKTQGHVGQVVIGGRAQEGPMQAVGAVKGANVYTYDYLLQLATEAYTDAPKSEKKAYQNQWGEAFAGVTQAITRSIPSGDGAHDARVNIRNNIRKGDKSLTPLQFVYEAADCRLFYTAEQIVNQALVWKAAYNSYWGDGACVKGSTNQVSSKPGVNYILYNPEGKAVQSKDSKDSNKNAAGRNFALSGMTALLALFAAFAVYW